MSGGVSGAPVRTGGPVAIGSRGSALALAQARLASEALERAGVAVRIVIVETEGDRRAPDTAWGEGAFVAAIERALLDGRVDVAVHSAKDVPTDQDPRLRLAAYLPRADPRDALVVRGDATARRLADLPPGTRVGTDSPRRAGFLLARRPDLRVHALHGNVDTRLRRLDDGETDALVLACAGLDRLGLGSRIAERLAPEIVPPAPGQGAIALQVRADDERLLALAGAVDDRPTRLAVEAERTFLRASGGGCRSPIGAYAEIAGDELELLGGSAELDGSRTTVGRRRGAVATAETLARELADELRERARDPEIGGPDGRVAWRPAGRRVLVTRAAGQSAELAAALRDAGLEPVAVPAIAIETDPPGGDLDRAAAALDTFRWVVLTSANGAQAILDSIARLSIDPAGPSWAAIGSATAAILEEAGVEVRFRPSRGSGGTLAGELPIVPGDRVLVVRGDLADGTLAERLRARGAAVDDVIAYRTLEAPASSLPLLGAALDDGVDAIAFTSGSTVRGLLSLARATGLDVRSIPAVCIGPGTAREAADAGFRVVATATEPDARGLATATADALGATLQEIH